MPKKGYVIYCKLFIFFFFAINQYYYYNYTKNLVLSLFVLDLSTKQLENNTKICEELLRLADVLEPGITRFRGLLLFYLVCGLKQLKNIKKKSVSIYVYKC